VKNVLTTKNLNNRFKIIATAKLQKFNHNFEIYQANETIAGVSDYNETPTVLHKITAPLLIALRDELSCFFVLHQGR